MVSKLRNTIVSLLSAATLLVLPVVVPAVVSADDPSIQGSLCQGSTLQVSGTPANDNTCESTTSSGTTGINKIITDVINIFSVAVGVVAVIMIIAGGFRYITSGGDSNKISGAKNTIIYALIGLVVVALAQLIVKFVLNKVSSSTTP
jgi:cytochrome bd-type quinol oxidase subunit 2